MTAGAPGPDAASITSVRLASVATAAPPIVFGQAEAERVLVERYRDRLTRRALAAMHKCFSHPSIRRRRFAVEDVREPLDEDPDRRIDRFTRWAVRLSSEAAGRALDRAGVAAESLSAVVVNTCTGYICPGISTYLLEAMGLPATTHVYDLVGAGCGGAVPSLRLTESLAAKGTGPALCVSVEICSATFQMGEDLGLIVSNSLFSDGAGAAVVWTRPQGLSLVDSQSLTAPRYRDDIRYVYNGGQLHNQLSMSLPRVVGAEAPGVVMPLLARHGLDVGDVRHWAVHPGGEKVISAIKGALGLDEGQLQCTREVLAEYGNVSSATVWFELERILDAGVAPGEWVVMFAVGAGFSAHAMLLRA